MSRYSMTPCPCGSGKDSHWQCDARGIELCRTCVECHDEKMAKHRPDVLKDPNYWTDEPVEPEPVVSSPEPSAEKCWHCGDYANECLCSGD